MVIDALRSAICTPLKTQERKKLVKLASAAKVISASAGLVGLLADYAFRNVSFIGTPILIAGALTAVISREVFTVASNIENLCNDNIAKRTLTATTTNSLTKAVFKNTITSAFVFKN